MPLPVGPNFPVPTATINGWIDAGDTAAIRGHAWSLWQAMAAPSGETFNGQELPIWETWAGPNDVFPSNLAAVAAGTNGTTLEARLAKPRVIRNFAAPLQFHHSKGVKLGFAGHVRQFRRHRRQQVQPAGRRLHRRAAGGAGRGDLRLQHPGRRQ